VKFPSGDLNCSLPISVYSTGGGIGGGGGDAF
jgi:hypothetical protein